MAYIVRAYDGDEMNDSVFEREDDAMECVYDYCDGFDYHVASEVKTAEGDMVIILIGPEVARMSGLCEVCTHCGGEMRMVADDSLGFTVKLGICPNCNHGQVVTPDEVTFDDELSNKAVGLLMNYRREQEDKHRIPVIDNNGFQMRCKIDPRDSKGYCASCSHSHAIVEDGEYHYKMDCDLGHKCFKHDCEDWEPTKVWAGMGNNCRHCYNSYITEDRVPMCRIRDVPTRSVSDYVKGNCEDYEPCTDWDFEKMKYVPCPCCGGTAYVHRRGRVKCRCGYIGWGD